LDQLFSRLSALETVLWILAVVVAFVAFLVIAPSFFTNPTPSITSAAQFTATPRATLTPLPSATEVLGAPPPKVSTLAPIPTPPPNAEAFTFVANPKQSGWIASGEKDPHWGDRNIHAGQYKGQTFKSLLYFDLSVLAPGSRILYADVELTGLNRSNLGTSGNWSLKLLPATLLTGWLGHSVSELAQSSTLDQIGRALEPADLAEGRTNQFVFSSNQLSRLEQALDQTGQIAFRLDGPQGPADSLFTWDGGDPDPTIGAHPVMRVIAVPGQFIPITNTPTPQNVLTVAAQVAQATEFAIRYGTPTPFPRAFATYNPLQVVTSQPTPANSATAQAQAAYATAVAMTTGTFTPTPPYLITTTPTPPFLALGQFTPVATPTPTPFVSRLQLLQTPIPTQVGLSGDIAFLSDREGTGTPQVWVMNPSGTILGKLSSDEYYRIAENQALFSPDKLFQVDVGKCDNGVWQIVMLDISKGTLSPLIADCKGHIGAYHPAWSPLGDKIVYVSDRETTDEIYVYDLKTKTSARLTTTLLNQKTWELAQNNHPAWSPDGKQIVFASNRDPFPMWQIWIMDANGGNLRKLSSSPYNDTAPVWIR
jgi:hypothetical protein